MIQSRANPRAAFAKAQPAKATKRTKDSRGVWHRSPAEATWFDGLYAREKAGLIRIDASEPKWELKIRDKHLCWVEGDATVTELKAPGLGLAAFRPGVPRHLDYKGWKGDTPISRHKRKHLKMDLGIELELVGEYADRQAAKKAKAATERALLKRAKQRT